ncbi:MAG: DegT/DnrJ/EryC1/StrS family aminotransferase [Cyanobacteriota bacterium]|nr:DegT/DnrJ/EryC1/StrS family aminotransferase [Cyanobacteriota bacterium]
MAPTPRQIVLPMQYLHGPPLRSADWHERRFVEALGTRLGLPLPALPVGRARGGLLLLLQLLISPGRQRVLLSPYTLPDVVAMVRFAGGEPVFIDHQPGSTALDHGAVAQHLDERVAALLVTHYHLNQPQLAQLRQRCHGVGARLLEDCAISLGGELEADDHNPASLCSVGLGGDAGVFSFSAFKFINHFWGGAIVTRDPDLHAALSERLAAMPRLGPWADHTQYRGIVGFDLATRRLPFRLLTHPQLLRQQQRSGLVPSIAPPRLDSTVLQASLASRPGSLALSQWRRKLPRLAQHQRHRRRIAAIYRQHLGSRIVGLQQDPAAPSLEQLWQGSCFANLPILVPAEQRANLQANLLRHGFDVGLNHYPNAHRHQAFAGCCGSSTEVDRLCAEMLTLPTHPRVSSRDAQRISQLLLEQLAS